MAEESSTLFALANAPDWSSFALTDRESSVDAAEAVSGSFELLHALAPVLARGMQLLSEQQLDVTTLQQHESGVRALVTLAGEWGVAAAALQRRPDRERGVALALQMTETGMIGAYEQLCRTLARFISSPAAHGTAAAAALKASGMQQLTAKLLGLLGKLVQGWPGNKALSNAAVAAAVPTVCELAVAALRNSDACWAAPASGSSSSSGHSTAAAAAASVADAIYTGSQPGADGVSALHAVPRPIADSSCVMQLMMAHLALTAQAIHQQQHGLPAVAAGASAHTSGQPVPPYHQQLLDALGVAERADLALDSDTASSQGLLWAALSGVRCVRFRRPRSSNDDGSSDDDGSDVAATAGQQQEEQCRQQELRRQQQEQRRQQELRRAEQEQAVDLTLLPPLLFVLLECSALLPGAATATACLAAMERLLTDRYYGISESLARDLPPALLQLLLPAIRPASDAAAAAIRALSAEPGSLTALVSAVILAMTQSVCHTGYQECGPAAWAWDRPARALGAAFLRHLHQYCAVFEAALRRNVGKGVVVRISCLLEAAACYASTEGISLSAGDQQQVFALLLSCLKAATAKAAAPADTVMAAMTPILWILSTAQPVRNAWLQVHLFNVSSNSSPAGADAAGPSSSSSPAGADIAAAAASGPSSSSSSSSNPASRAPSKAWLSVHMLGRCLVAAGRALQQASSTMPLIVGSRRLIGPTTFLDDVATVLPGLSETEVPAPVVQQLLERQAALLPQVNALHERAENEQGNCFSTAVTGLAVLHAEMGKQLEAYGAALCAQVPLKCCCNNHLCSNISKASELQLVSGPCVCGGCRAARYCSRECQAAHYKRWHKAVCQRLQQQG